MVSRVFFRWSVNGKTYEGYSDIKQVVGGDFEKDPIEVSPPLYMRHPNYAEFRAHVEEYYRSQVGARGQAFRITGGAKGISRTSFRSCTYRHGIGMQDFRTIASVRSIDVLSVERLTEFT
jgi:hypothetical protein